MAQRGDMAIENYDFGVGAEILNRPPYEAVPVTVDFSSASKGDQYKESDDGELYVPAGMPVDKSGHPQNTSPSDIVGILLYDVHQGRPQGAALTKAYVNEERAKKSSGVSSYDAFKTGLPMIVFE